LRNAAQSFDGWIPTSPTPEAFEQGLDAIRRRAAEVGRQSSELATGVYLTVNLNPDRSKAETETDEYMQGYYGIPLEIMKRVQGVYCGDVDECVAWVKRYVTAGAGHVVLRFATLDPMPQIERAAGEVVPELRGADV
jgi:alkanesulfonate monooxygenase SsuD/methylene tetrahydromethanopterin reductase-like flavin-dependent oxidoreductase (luciferase family)